MKKLYILPEYLKSALDIDLPLQEVPIDTAYKYLGVTVSELAEAYGLKTFDVALPQDYVDNFKKLTGFNPVGHMVMNYDSVFGSLFPVTSEGKVALKIYNHILEGGK